MALSDLVSAGLEGPVAAVRRHAISLSIAIVAAVAALIYAASAMLLALELAARTDRSAPGRRLGPPDRRRRRLFRARMLRRPAPARETAADPEMENLSRDQRIAMVLEALMLGFSMGSRKPADNADSSK